MAKPEIVHTCHGNEHMPPGPCVACAEEQAEQDALAGQAEAEKAQEAQEAHGEQLWAGYPLTWGDEG